MIVRVVLLHITLLLATIPLFGQAPPPASHASRETDSVEWHRRAPDFDRMLQRQAETDRTWRAASDGYMQMRKITYRSRADDLDIPAFVFEPLRVRGPKGHAAIVWVHENIHGHVYEHYIPYIREATEKGYVVIAPEYRGSFGYGKTLYDAIDYGGAEVDDVVMAVVYKDRSPLFSVDKLQIPLLVHVTKNDEDVNIEEDMQLVDALRARKPFLAETKVYDSPPGGHTFDRRVDPETWQPENTREQRDSWNRVWTFLDWNLDPFHDGSGMNMTTQQR